MTWFTIRAIIFFLRELNRAGLYAYYTEFLHFREKSHTNQNLYALPLSLFLAPFTKSRIMSVAENESTNDTDVQTVASVGQKRPRDSDDDHDDDDQQVGEHGERKEERKAANRRSAFQSRLRKKLLIEELQKKVSTLTEELSILKDNNRTLTQGLEASLSENRKLRFMHQQGGRMGIPGMPMGGKNAFLGLQGGNMGGLMGFRGF